MRRDDDLLTFLATRDAPYCFRCLATAFPHRHVKRDIEEVQRSGAPVIIGEGRCAICQFTTTVVAYVPNSPDLPQVIRPAYLGETALTSPLPGLVYPLVS